jgi:N-acetylmuramoyl-L-alanine amidase
MKEFFKLIIEFFKNLFSKNNEENETIETNDAEISNENDTIVNYETIDENEEYEEEILSVPQNNNKTVILIDNGHGNNTSGKRSPYSACGTKPEIDFYEYKWNREIANEIVNRLKAMNYDARLLVPEINDISLTARANRANKVCNEVGTHNVILISVHANAAGNGRQWYNAQGWSAFTTKGKTKSDVLAECLYDEAEKNFKGRKIRTDKSDGDRDWEENFTIIYKSWCPAVLTENFFYDNIDDVRYILSNEGREAVIKTHIDGIISYLNSK